MGIPERFRQMRKYLGYNQSQLGDFFNLSQDSISAIETGRNKPTIEVLVVLKEEFDVNIEWVLTGTGSMFRNQPVPLEETEEQRKGIYIPVAKKTVPNNYGIEAVKIEAEEYLPLPAKFFTPFPQEKIKIVKIETDSMQPYLLTGDYIAYIEEYLPKTDGVYIINKSGILSVNRLYFKTNGNVVICSDNEKYPNEEVSFNNSADFIIVGKAVAKVRLTL